MKNYNVKNVAQLLFEIDTIISEPEFVQCKLMANDVIICLRKQYEGSFQELKM